MATNDEAETAAAGANPYSPAETPQEHEQPNSGAAAGQKVGGLGFNVGGTFVGGIASKQDYGELIALLKRKA